MSPPQQLRQWTSNCSSLLIYRLRKDERLSWPSWLIYSGRLTHISGHPSATGRAQDSESTPAKDRCCTAGPRNQHVCGGRAGERVSGISFSTWSTAVYGRKNLAHVTQQMHKANQTSQNCNTTTPARYHAASHISLAHYSHTAEKPRDATRHVCLIFFAKGCIVSFYLSKLVLF